MLRANFASVCQDSARTRGDFSNLCKFHAATSRFPRHDPRISYRSFLVSFRFAPPTRAPVQQHPLLYNALLSVPVRHLNFFHLSLLPLLAAPHSLDEPCYLHQVDDHAFFEEYFSILLHRFKSGSGRKARRHNCAYLSALLLECPRMGHSSTLPDADHRGT